MSLNPVIAAVTQRIVERSKGSRAAYLANMQAAIDSKPGRAKLSCANWAHAFAGQTFKQDFRATHQLRHVFTPCFAYHSRFPKH